MIFIDSGKRFTVTTQVQVFIVINFKNRQLQMQLSQKLQRFRIYCKNKQKIFWIFHELSEYVQKLETFFRPDWSFKSENKIRKARVGIKKLSNQTNYYKVRKNKKIDRFYHKKRSAFTRVLILLRKTNCFN